MEHLQYLVDQQTSLTTSITLWVKSQKHSWCVTHCSQTCTASVWLHLLKTLLLHTQARKSLQSTSVRLNIRLVNGQEQRCVVRFMTHQNVLIQHICSSMYSHSSELGQTLQRSGAVWSQMIRLYYVSCRQHMLHQSASVSPKSVMVLLISISLALGASVLVLVTALLQSQSHHLTSSSKVERGGTQVQVGLYSTQCLSFSSVLMVQKEIDL